MGGKSMSSGISTCRTGSENIAIDLLGNVYLYYTNIVDLNP
jgi:hypothetical protein